MLEWTGSRFQGPVGIPVFCVVLLIALPRCVCTITCVHNYREQTLSSQVLRPQPVELDAFARLMRAHAILRRELDAEVLRPRGLTINDFEALMHLSRAEEQRLRRVDLVERLMLTPSGVTRLLEGLQEAGLVENVHCES